MNPAQKAVTGKYANVLRPLLAEERAKLRASLQKDGLLSDLIRDQHGDLLDGHTRKDLCEELGIEPRYRDVMTNDPVNWIKGMQQARRNLNREEMTKLTEEQVVATPHLSDREIAKTVGVSTPTVSKVRNRLVAAGKVTNVVRFEASGRMARGTISNVKSLHKDEPEPSQPIVSAETKKSLYGEPPVLELRDGRVRGLQECVIYRYADDGDFHSIPRMTSELDPDGQFKLTPGAFQKVAHAIQRDRKDIYIETRPGLGQQRQYRFYRQDKTVGLSVLKVKFRPVIEALIKEGQRPISYQSTGRFNDAAAMLIQLLRDLEGE